MSVVTRATPSVLVVHPSAELYGSDRTLAESVMGLIEQGSRVTVALSAEGPLGDVLHAAGADVRVVTMPVLRKSLATPRGVVDLGRTLPESTMSGSRLLRELRPDVVYVNTVTVPLWIPLARSVGAEVLCHVHEAEADSPAPVRAALAAPLLAAHRVITNSAASREVLIGSLPGLRSRTRVIYNGVAGPTTSITPVRDQLTGTIRLVLVGRLSARKGSDLAIRALARLVSAGHDVTLSLVGDVFPGYEWFANDLRTLASELGVGGRVHFIGVVEDVWDQFAANDIALVPSRVEPFGNVAVEAMLARRPLVASTAQGLREIVREGENALTCAPNDVASLTDAVTRTLEDWPAARVRAERAYGEAHDRFSPTRYRREIAAAVHALPPQPTQVRSG